MDIGPRISVPGGFTYIWQSKWVGIIVIKTERTQIHFLSDVLVDVASLDFKVSILAENAIVVVILPQVFWESVIVAETSYQMFVVYHFVIKRERNLLQYK